MVVVHQSNYGTLPSVCLIRIPNDSGLDDEDRGILSRRQNTTIYNGCGDPGNSGGLYSIRSPPRSPKEEAPAR